MSGGSARSVAFFVMWRNLRTLLRNPPLVFPAILLPLFFMVAFTGALSSLTNVANFGSDDYTAFQYVFVLMQAAAFTGAMAGFAIAEDLARGFMGRLMLAASNRAAIIVGYVLAQLARLVLAIVVLTGVAFALGMEFDGGPLDVVGLLGLAVLLTVAMTLWSAGVALRVGWRGASFMVLPVFLLLFLAPVFVPLDLMTGWLKTVARFNPLTVVLEAGRGFVAGQPVDVLLAYAVVVAMILVLAIWALLSVRKAETAGA